MKNDAALANLVAVMTGDLLIENSGWRWVDDGLYIHSESGHYAEVRLEATGWVVEWAGLR